MNKNYFYSYQAFSVSGIIVGNGSGVISIGSKNVEELFDFISEKALNTAKRDLENVNAIVLVSLNEV